MVAPDSVAVAEQTPTARVRVFARNSIGQRLSMRIVGMLQGAIIALHPFAYYAVGSTIRHADLNSGSLETMVDVRPDARPIAVVNR